MHKILFEVYYAGGYHPVSSYMVIGLLGLFIGFYACWWLAINRGISKRQFWICAAAMIPLIFLGSRLTDCLNHPDNYQSLQSVFQIDAGMVLYGGLIIMLVGGFVTCRILDVDPWSFMDYIAPGIGLGIAISAIACFMNGCCFGRPTNLPWAVVFPADSQASIFYYHSYITQYGDTIFRFYQPLTVHPTQLYESIAGLIGGSIAWILLRKKAFSGVPFLSMLLVYYTLRAFNWYWRAVTITNPLMIRIWPWIVVIVVLVIMVLLIWRINNQPDPDYSEQEK